MERYTRRLDEYPFENTVRPTHIVIAHSDSQYVVELGDRLLQRGCAVHFARNGDQARLLAHHWRADVVVLDTDMHFESGWLTADKLGREDENVRTILVAPEVTYRDRQLARFVHAYAVVDQLEGPEAIVDKLDEMEGATLARK
jgi:DNA-binding NtrC family response regulator